MYCGATLAGSCAELEHKVKQPAPQPASDGYDLRCNYVLG